jgi:hypothetical protein
VSGRSDAEGAKNVVVDLETGKYLESRVEIIGGHEERILNRGIEMDKIFVLYAMSMRGYPAPKYERAQLAANYFDLLKTFTLERFSSIIREDHKVNLVTKQGADGDFHPVVGRVDAADPTVLQAKIAPSTSLAIREYATIFATSFDNNGNRTFGDYVDYRIKGVDAAFPAGVTTAEFTSASGLNTYVVADTADGLSISFEIARKAQETASKVAAAKEAMTNAPAGDELKAQAIVKFGEAWAIGNGEPMGDDIVAILEGNFDPNVPIMRLLTDQFVAGTEDPELLAKITAIRDELNAILDQYEAIASTRAELESMVQDGERALTGYETDLIHLKDMYQIFK